MTKRNILMTSGLATLSLFVLGAQAVASDAIAFNSEIHSCVDAVADHANYSDASRVQHTVVKAERAFLGYALTIDTAVFAASDDDVAIRYYATYCVANGRNKPLKFRISEVDIDS